MHNHQQLVESSDLEVGLMALWQSYNSSATRTSKTGQETRGATTSKLIDMIILLSDIRSHVVDKSIRSEKEGYISSQRRDLRKTKKIVPPPAPICHPVLVKTPFHPALWTSNWLQSALLSQPSPAPVTAHGIALPNIGLRSHASGTPFEDGKNTLEGWSGI